MRDGVMEEERRGGQVPLPSSLSSICKVTRKDSSFENVASSAINLANYHHHFVIMILNLAYLLHKTRLFDVI